MKSKLFELDCQYFKFIIVANLVISCKHACSSILLDFTLDYKPNNLKNFSAPLVLIYVSVFKIIISNNHNGNDDKMLMFQ